MGHNVNAYRNDPRLAETKAAEDAAYLAYLRRGAFDPHCKGIYIVLGALDQYGGTGGLGGVIEYQPNPILEAIDSVQKLDAVAVELTPTQESLLNSLRSLAEDAGGVMKIGAELAKEQGIDLSNADYSREFDFLRQCNTGNSVWIKFA